MQAENISDWRNDEALSKEFESVGFYISNHPLKNFESILNQYNAKSFKDFEDSNDKESLLLEL